MDSDESDDEDTTIPLEEHIDEPDDENTTIPLEEHIDEPDDEDTTIPLEEQIHDFNMNAVQNHVNEMEYAINEHGYNVNNINDHGQTALRIATWRSSPSTIEFLLNKVRDPNVLDNNGESALMVAADRGDVEIFFMINRKLEEARLPIRLLSNIHVNGAGKTLLMRACNNMYRTNKKSYDLVRMLLDAGFDPYVKDHQGRTALHHAVQSKLLTTNATVLMLLESRPENTLVHVKDKDGNTALHLACIKTNCSTVVVSTLLAHGARASDTNLKLETPLHTTARLGVHEVVPLLVEARADTQARDILGRTPTHAAVETRTLGVGVYRSSDSTCFLLESLMATWNPRYKLLHLSVKDNNGMTPLLLACQPANRSVVVRLINIPGINIDAVDIKGETVLHRCVRCGWPRVIEALITLGVKIHVRDDDGKTPLDIAYRLGIYSDNMLLCLNILLHQHTLSEMRFNTISMGLHERLGAKSQLRLLNIWEIEQMIARHL